MRQHLLEQFGEAVEVVVAVVLVVDDADVLELEVVDDGELVFGFAEPAAVVVERDRAAQLLGFLRNRANDLCGRFHLVLLFLAAGLAHRDPELRLQLVLLHHGEQGLSIGTEVRREPDGREFDTGLLKFDHFAIEGGQVLGSPVVGVLLEAELLEHGDAFLGRTLLGIEGNDAPGDEVAAIEEFRIGLRSNGGRHEEGGSDKSEKRAHSDGTFGRVPRLYSTKGTRGTELTVDSPDSGVWHLP